MACDLCNKTGTRPSDLRTIYATDGVQSICPDCETVVNRHLSKMQRVSDNMVQALFKRYLLERKQNARPAIEPPKGGA